MHDVKLFNPIPGGRPIKTIKTNYKAKLSILKSRKIEINFTAFTPYFTVKNSENGRKQLNKVSKIFLLKYRNLVIISLLMDICF